MTASAEPAATPAPAPPDPLPGNRQLPFDLRSPSAVLRKDGDAVVAGNWGGVAGVARLDVKSMT